MGSLSLCLSLFNHLMAERIPIHAKALLIFLPKSMPGSRKQ
jgi:hypothetical protein